MYDLMNNWKHNVTPSSKKLMKKDFDDDITLYFERICRAN